MNNDQIKTLIQKRAIIKSSITRFKSFLDKITTEIAVNQLQERMEKIRESWNNFEAIQTELEILTDQNAEQIKEREQFEESYFEVIGRGQGVLKELTIQSSASPLPSSQNSSTLYETAPHVKLPTIELPSYSGKYENWIGFYDTFKALIHDNISITPVQKLYYLRSCLKDEAAQTIQSLKTSSDNYTVAWSLLKERYDNRRAIIQSHIRQLFEYTTLTKESANGLRSLLDNALKHIRALKVLDEPTDSWSSLLIHIITTKLDRNTRREWEHSITGTAMPSIEELWTFLRNRCHALENINSENTTIERKMIRSAAYNAHSALTSNKASGNVGSTSKSVCSFCKEDHNIQTCEKFRALGLHEKTEVVKRAGLCFNCLRMYHLVSACNSAHCRKCGKKHHYLLHPTQEKQRAKDDANIERSESQNLASLQAVTTSQVLLSTASAQIMDNSGKLHRCKLLLDSGSQSNFITEKLASRLRLNKSRVDVPVSGFNEALTHISSAVSTTIQSTDKRFTKDLSFLVISRITNVLPSQQIERKNLEIPKNIVLADPEFHKPSEIDILIGAELFYTLLSIGQIKLKTHEVILQKTKLGWIISGRIPMKENRHTRCHLANSTLERQIEKCWEMEELPAMKYLSDEEAACEEHFNRHTTRNITGRYCVRLPFNEKKNELQEIQSLLTSQEHKQYVDSFLTNQGIQRSFIPPRSPHFGGLWEAAVKAFKHHFKRTIGDQLLTVEEINTFAIEIEGILNSSPLTSLSSHPNDLIALCPNHFLLGVSLPYLPEHGLTQTPSNRLTSWQHIQKMRQPFWQGRNKEKGQQLSNRSWDPRYPQGRERATTSLGTWTSDRVAPRRGWSDSSGHCKNGQWKF